MDIDVTDTGVDVVGRARSAHLDWGWLLDHSDDPASVDAATGQRKGQTFGAETPPAPAVTIDAQRVSLEWPNRITSVSLGLIASVVDLPEPQPGNKDITAIGQHGAHLWDGARPTSVEAVGFAGLVDGSELGRFVGGLQQRGFAVVEDVPLGRQGVEAVAERIGYVRRTIFGDVWELAADVSGHADSAYSQVFLGPHTDATYMHDAPGLQLFVCQEWAAQGGRTILTDGFAAAERIWSSAPEQASLLANNDVVGRYVEPGVYLQAARPALRLDRFGQLVQVSYNNYDRAAFHLGDSDHRFRLAYAALAREVDDQAHWITLDWAPGRALVFDNWRVLHAREQFSGIRRFLGAYLNHEDLESAVRLNLT
ncbi:MAG: TauD/TfdA family dioxygenase [Acidimicrobiales bacterium]